MGTPKYALTLGSETLLQRICRIVSESTSSVMVVAAPDQPMPALPDGITVLRDAVPGQGPLAGITTGLNSCPSVRAGEPTQKVFVTACDAPLLQSRLIDLLYTRLADHDAIVIRSGDRLNPLCAVYDTRITGLANKLLQQGERRPRVLLESIDTRFVDEDVVREVDPQLLSLKNANTPEEFDELAAAYTTEIKSS